MLRLHLRLVRALQISGWLPRVFHPELVILFRLAVRRLSTETYNLDFEVLQWSKLVEIWGTQNETKIQPPTERLHFTCGQLQLLTSNNSPRNSGTLLMGCVTASGAPDGNRKASRSDSRGVFVGSKLRASSTKIFQNRENISIHARELNTMSTSSMQKRLLPRVCCSPGG